MLYILGHPFQSLCTFFYLKIGINRCQQLAAMLNAFVKFNIIISIIIIIINIKESWKKQSVVKMCQARLYHEGQHFSINSWIQARSSFVLHMNGCKTIYLPWLCNTSCIPDNVVYSLVKRCQIITFPSSETLIVESFVLVQFGSLWCDDWHNIESWADGHCENREWFQLHSGRCVLQFCES